MGVLPGPNTSSNVPAPKVCMSEGPHAEGVTEQGALCRGQRASPNKQQVLILFQGSGFGDAEQCYESASVRRDSTVGFLNRLTDLYPDLGCCIWHVCSTKSRRMACWGKGK